MHVYGMFYFIFTLVVPVYPSVFANVYVCMRVCKCSHVDMFACTSVRIIENICVCAYVHTCMWIYFTCECRLMVAHTCR
jgi:hypothetical protein